MQTIVMIWNIHFQSKCRNNLHEKMVHNLAQKRV